MDLDLGSLASVGRFAQAFASRYMRLDALVLNAGVMHPPFTLSADGLELTFAVNHVGHQYLTRLLLPLLRQSQPAYVTSVASNAAFMSYSQGVRLSRAAINDPESYSAPLACA